VGAISHVKKQQQQQEAVAVQEEVQHGCGVDAKHVRRALRGALYLSLYLLRYRRESAHERRKISSQT
jgi:hypothetical protein